jgi:2-polyprenyl-3-methyl-5-hydroxy-6-metoxy-1,4-benzoquinol methylase
MALISYKSCPSCKGNTIREVLCAEDFTVSHEIFGIWECGDCSLRFTQLVPDLESSGSYYKASAYISHTDTREGLVNKIYHQVRKITLKQKRRMVENSTRVSQGSLLDIGAGTGAFAASMKAAGWQVKGIEPDAEARAKARDRYGLELLDPGELSGLQEQSFDAITLWHVLEHVHDLHGYLGRIYSLLRPGGRLLVAVPNYTSLDAGHYGKYWAAYDVPRHLYHFSPLSVRRLFKSHGLNIVSKKPMWYDSFYISLLSEKYRNGKGNMVRAVWTGLRSNFSALINRDRCSSLVYIAGRIN